MLAPSFPSSIPKRARSGDRMISKRRRHTQGDLLFTEEALNLYSKVSSSSESFSFDDSSSCSEQFFEEQRKGRGVVFTTVSVYEHNLAAAHSTSFEYELPMLLDWQQAKASKWTVDEYEYQRKNGEPLKCLTLEERGSLLGVTSTPQIGNEKCLSTLPTTRRLASWLTDEGDAQLEFYSCSTARRNNLCTTNTSTLTAAERRARFAATSGCGGHLSE